MTWTYHAGESTRDWIRLVIGDTNKSNQLLQDEDIDAIIAVEGSGYASAAACADALAGKYAGSADKTVGRFSIKNSQLGEHYSNLANRLRTQLGSRVQPYAGGISVSDKEAVEEDTDIVQPQFSIGLHDIPGSDTTSTEDEC